jgi:hypothetical protein
MQLKRLLCAASILAVLAAGSIQYGLYAADHGDAPLVRVDPRLDIPDVYAFQSPSTPGNVVFIMTLSPLARIVSQNNFNPRADHDFFVNTNADPDYEFAFNFRFGMPGPGNLQSIRFVGESRTTRLFEVLGTTGENIPLPGGGFIRANEIDDPFFFDFIAFRSGRRICAAGPGATSASISSAA